VEPDDSGVLIRGVISWRDIDIEIAKLSQGVRPNSAVASVIVGIVNYLAGQPAVMPVQVEVPERTSGLEGSWEKEQGEKKAEPTNDFHNDALGADSRGWVQNKTWRKASLLPLSFD
jgi:hypothetical protein